MSTLNSQHEEIAKNVFHAELAQVLPKFAEFQKELPSLDHVIRDQELALTPRLFLAKAMESFTLGHFYAAVLLAGTAVDIGIREIMKQQLTKHVQGEIPRSLVSQLIEEFDFRKALNICKEFEVFGSKDDKVYGMLNQCFDKRNPYSHGDVTKILGKKVAKQPLIIRDSEGKAVQFGTIGDSELFRNAYVEALVAHDDALELIRLVGQAFEIIRKCTF